MIVTTFGKKFTPPIAVALGFFDCVHLGHAALMRAAVQAGAKKNALPAAFTFRSDPDGALNGGRAQLLPLSARVERMKELGIRVVIVADPTLAFLKTSPQDFLKTLFREYTVEATIVGEDYRFGRKAAGDIKLLGGFCRKNDAEQVVVPITEWQGERISTTRIRKLLLDGKTSEANALLGYEYSIDGRVTHGKGLGGNLGFATANFAAEELSNLKPGVYATRVRTDCGIYPAVTNVGTQPTVGGEEIRAESYLIGFNGDLYDKKIVVYFGEYLREIVKFHSIEELKSQISKDVARAKRGS